MIAKRPALAEAAAGNRISEKIMLINKRSSRKA